MYTEHDTFHWYSGLHRNVQRVVHSQAVCAGKWTSRGGATQACDCKRDA